MRLRELLRTLDATLVEIRPSRPQSRCQMCQVRCEGYADGRPVLCRHCTLAELGVSEYTLGLMIEFGLSRKVVETRLEKYGPPYVSPKEWLTPKSRLRK